MGDELRFCPNCGSLNVEPDTSNRAEVYFSGGNPNSWKCNDCSYTGLVPEGDPDEFEEGIEEVEFEPGEDYRMVDTGFGRAYLKFIVYVVVPFTTIYILYLYI